MKVARQLTPGCPCNKSTVTHLGYKCQVNVDYLPHKRIDAVLLNNVKSVISLQLLMSSS